MPKSIRVSPRGNRRNTEPLPTRSFTATDLTATAISHELRVTPQRNVLVDKDCIYIMLSARPNAKAADLFRFQVHVFDSREPPFQQRPDRRQKRAHFRP